MVNYKVRAFYEKDTGSVGADLVIYSDTGDVIDTLLITTQGQFNELVSRLDGIDQQYLDLNELKQYLQNTGNTEITINATKLNGLTVDDFARQNHNHDGLYARINHADSQVNYGVGAPDKYGHNKVIDNCNQTAYRPGESLSAYQGKLLNDRISSVDVKLGTWNYTSDICTDGNEYIKGYVNPYLRVIYATVDDIFTYTTKHKNEYIKTGAKVKSGYKPKRTVFFASHTPYTVGKIDTDGVLYGKSIYSDNKESMNLKGTCWWVY